MQISCSTSSAKEKKVRNIQSHLGKYWECLCRTLWSTAGATYTAKVSGVCSAPPSAPGRRYWINQLLAISDWSALCLFNSPYSSTSPSAALTHLPNTFASGPGYFSEQVTLSVHHPGLLGKYNSWYYLYTKSSSHFEWLTAASTQCFCYPALEYTESSAESGLGLTMDEIILCGTSSAKYM